LFKKTLKSKRNDFGGFFNNSLIQLVLVIWALFQLYPVIWLFYSSFKPTPDIRSKLFALPEYLYLKNYDINYYHQKGITIGIYLRNSTIVTVVSILILTFVCLIAGYAIAKIKFPGKNLLIIFLIGLIGIPIHSLIIPLYYFIARMGLLSTLWGLILPYIAFGIPFSVLMLQTYFRQFPDELIEAAMIDGCSHLRLFFTVVVPISLGAISTVLIVNFISIWNEFLFSLVINRDNAAKTLTVGIMGFKGQYVTDWGPYLAGLVIAVVPSIIFYAIFHRNIIKGMTAGSLKG